MKNKQITEQDIRQRVNLYNEQTVQIQSDISVFQKIRNIERYGGVTKEFTLSNEIVKTFPFDNILLEKTYLLQDKIRCLKYHISNMKSRQKEHKEALIMFAKMYKNNEDDIKISITHPASKTIYEFEAFQTQFKATLDLLANIIFYIYKHKNSDSPFRSLKNVLNNNLKGKYLSDKILKFLSKNKWTDDYLSNEKRQSVRDKAIHYPWQLKYNYSELDFIANKPVYKPTGIEKVSLYSYCFKHYKNLCKLIDSILGIIFETK